MRHATTSRITRAAIVALPLLAACARGGAPDTGVAPAAALATAAPADSFLVRFATTKGDFDAVFRAHWAPRGAARVREAVDARYYDRARFFRAVRGFVVQWGIAADSATTAGWRGRRIDDDSVRQSNRRGTIAFAAGGANTRTVQLFINLRDNARLDALGFAPAGEVVAGLDVVDALHTGYGDAPPTGQGPPQGRISAEGEAFLAREFPLLDQIRTARVVRVWGAR